MKPLASPRHDTMTSPALALKDPGADRGNATRDADVIRPRPDRSRGRLPDLPAAASPASPSGAAANRSHPLGTLYLLTLLAAVDGSLVALGASGTLDSLGGAITVGLTVIAGFGSWLAARQAFARPDRSRRDLAVLATLGLLTLAATVASVWVGTALRSAVQLHVLPKAAGLVMCAIAAETAGLRLPRLGRVPAPLAILAGAILLEAGSAWIPS